MSLRAHEVGVAISTHHQTSVGFKVEILSSFEIATSGYALLAMTDVNIMGKKQYCVYILTNSRHTVLYTGVTNNLERRLSEHKTKLENAFTKRYNVDQLVYYECGDDINIAIAREKQIKAGSRQDKIGFINSINPE